MGLIITRTVALFVAILILGGACIPTSVEANTPVSPGAQFYQQRFQSLYQQMQLLADPATAAAFKAKWEHKFDQTGDLDSREGTVTAIQKLMEDGSLLGCSAKFDGKCLYSRALHAYEQYHHSPGDGPDLADPVQRAKWSAEWEHKFDGSPDLKTIFGTESAIRKMRDSLGQRFDYVFGDISTLNEHEEMSGWGGIGVPLAVRNGQSVPLVAPLQLIAREPDSDGPAFGVVQNRDVIVKIDGKPIEGTPLDATLKSLFGKPGTHVKLTVLRNDKLVDVELIRAYSQSEIASGVATDLAGIGVPVEVSHAADFKLKTGFELISAGEPTDDSPAKGKIHAGDLITAVNGQSVIGLTMMQAVAKLRGQAGTTVSVTIQHSPASGLPAKSETLVLTRQLIKPHAVHYKLQDNDVSYIKLDSFEPYTVTTDMATAIARAVLPLASKALLAQKDKDPISVDLAARFDMVEKNLDNGGSLDESTVPIVIQARQVYEAIGTGGGIVLDLRDNPGGLINTFLNLAGMTLPQGTVMVTNEREAGTDQLDWHEYSLTPTLRQEAVYVENGATTEPKVEEQKRPTLLLPRNMPFVIVVNQNSASCSELLAGAEQANHRAQVVGAVTVGKGVAQVIVQLPYGISLHVTAQEFFPGGNRSDEIGIIPDIAVSESLDGKTDAQLNQALLEIKNEDERMSARALAVDAALKNHRAFFAKLLKERSQEDYLPLSKQDPASQN